MLAIFVANLGLAYWLQGRLEDAVRVLEEGLKEREMSYGLNDKHSFR